MKIDIHITDATPKELLELAEFLNDSDTPSVKSWHKGKWNIPFQSQFKTLGKIKANPEYTKALFICKKWGKPYEEALKLETGKSIPVFEVDLINESQRNEPAGNPPHWKEVIKNSANPPHTPIGGTP